MMHEEWRDVIGYEGRYKVSSLGRVKSIARVRRGKHGAPTPLPETIMKLSHDKSGYLKVVLRDGSTSSNHSVHQLVARAFIPNPNNYAQINHIDEDKENNCVSNLEWCDAKYNTNHGTRTARAALHIGKPVVAIKGSLTLHFDSARQASRELGIDASSITAVCTGRKKSAGGYVWRYERRNA